MIGAGAQPTHFLETDMSAELETRINRLERALRTLTTSSHDAIEALNRRVASLEKRLEAHDERSPAGKLPPNYRP